MSDKSGDTALRREVDKLKLDLERLREEQRKLLILSILICISIAVLFFLIGYSFPHPS